MTLLLSMKGYPSRNHYKQEPLLKNYSSVLSTKFVLHGTSHVRNLVIMRDTISGHATLIFRAIAQISFFVNFGSEEMGFHISP
jgi:hypothetical protein